jgi:hypothetical protein
MYPQPAKNLSIRIRSLVYYNTIGALSEIFLLTTTTHTQQSTEPRRPILHSLVWEANASPIKK